MIILPFVGALIRPAHNNFQDGTFITLNKVRIPFLQEDTTTEFIINIIQQVYISSFGISALLTIGGMIALTNNTTAVRSMRYKNLENFLIKCKLVEWGERNRDGLKITNASHSINKY